MEVIKSDGVRKQARWAIWAIRTTIAAVGIVISFLVANSTTRAQLADLGVGHALLPLAPICAGGSVLAGWYIGAELAGVRSESTGVARWAEGAMVWATGVLWVATAFCVLLQWPARWPDHTGVMLRMLAAMLPPVGFGIVSTFGSSPTSILPVNEDA
jgi:uncharacterized membrane protein YhdT